MRAAALEQALRDHPDDRASWRAYGDWLLERGDARGELISLEQRHAGARAADRAALEHQIAALVAKHQKSWDAALPRQVRVVARRGGFAVKVAVTWSGHAPVLIERALREPFVTALQIAPLPGRDREALIICITSVGWALVQVSEEDDPMVTRGTSEPDGTYLDFLLFDDEDDNVPAVTFSLSRACLIQPDLAVEAISCCAQGPDNLDAARFSRPGPLAWGLPGTEQDNDNEG